jgi:two-component system chemotaxis response regulator CheB
MGLNRDVPGIVITQHMPPGFTKMFADRLNNQTRLNVKEATTGDIIKPGHVLIAPGDKQMKVVKVGDIYKVECFNGPKVSGHCPSVDVLFDSVATSCGKDAIGVLLTGMGADGAKGLLKMKQAGAYTIGQDEASCIVYGMPKVANELGAVGFQVSLDKIPEKIYTLLTRK